MTDFLESLRGIANKVDSPERMALYAQFGEENYADAYIFNLFRDALIYVIENYDPASGQYIPTLDQVVNHGNMATNEIISAGALNGAGISPDGSVFFSAAGKRVVVAAENLHTNKSYFIDGSKPDGDNLAMLSDITGISIEVNQTTAELYLKDADGNRLATVNLGFLNNEGTTFFFNTTTNNLELKNDAGEVLSTIPTSSFVTNLVNSAAFSSGTPSLLEFKDNSNAVRYSVSFTVSNISGLQTLLDAKVGQTNSQISANTSGTNTYTAALSPAITTYTDKAKYYLKFTTANTGAATLNINSVGAKSITLFGSALVAGVIQANRVYMIIYNASTDTFALHGAQDPAKVNVAANSFLAGTTTRLVQAATDGTMSALFEILQMNRKISNGDVITAILSATYNSSNKFTSVITPANNAIAYEGQYYYDETTTYKYEVSANNTIKRYTAS